VIVLAPSCNWLADTVTRAMEEARFSEPRVTPVVEFVKIIVPVGTIPFVTPVAETENVTFCPGSTDFRVAVKAALILVFVIVTVSPVE
jgi:hypothetical protein